MANVRIDIPHYVIIVDLSDIVRASKPLVYSSRHHWLTFEYPEAERFPSILKLFVDHNRDFYFEGEMIPLESTNKNVLVGVFTEKSIDDALPMVELILARGLE